MRKLISVSAVLLVVFSVGLFVVNCGGGGGLTVPAANNQDNIENTPFPPSELVAEKQGFALRTWPDDHGFFGASQLDLEISKNGPITQVSIQAKAVGMKLAQFELVYDGQNLHPVNVEDGAWPGYSTGELLSLTMLDVENAVHHGTILYNPEIVDGVDGEFSVLVVNFSAGPQTVIRAASSAPTNAGDAVPNLSIDTLTGDVTFSYFNNGDYDQNSEVSITDITPIVLNYGETGPFDLSAVESVVDGDGNGEINITDITPIVLSYQNEISAWALYTGALVDYPSDAGDGNGAATKVGDVLYSNFSGDPGVDRLTLNGQFPALVAPTDLLAWVRPHGADGAEGIASAAFNMQTGVVDVDPPVWDDTVGITGAGSGIGKATISWGPATDALSPPVNYVVYYNQGTTVDFGAADTVEVSAPAVNTVVTGLTDGIGYAFAVRAKDSAVPPNEEDNTNEMTVMPGTDTSPPVWTGATGVGAMDVIPLDGGVRMVWGEATDVDSAPVTYIVYYNEGDTVDLGTASTVEVEASLPDPDPEVDQFIEIGGLANDTQYAFVVQAKDSAASPNQEGNTNTVTTTLLATAEMPPGSSGDTTFYGPMTVGLGNVAGLDCGADTEATFEFMSDLTIDGDLIPTDCTITIIVHGNLIVNGSIDHQITDPQPDANGDLPSLRLLLFGNFETGVDSVITGQGNLYIVDELDELISPEDAASDADNWDSDEFPDNLNPDEAAGGGGSFKGGSKATSATQYFGPAWTWRPKGNWTVPTPPRNINRIILRIFQRRGVTVATDFNLTGPPGAPGDPGAGCNAVGGVGEDNRFRLRWHTGRRLELNNCTIKLGDGGAGGSATTPGDCCPGVATGGNGGSPNNKFRITAGGSIQIDSFTLNPGNGGAGGSATASARDGVVGCPGENGCNADAFGGDGGDVPRWGIRIRGNVTGKGTFNLGTAEGGRGGNGTANAGKGGDGDICCDGGNGGLAIADGGNGGDSTFTGGSTAGGTPGGAQGGDGGAATANAKDGGDGGDCYKAPAGDGGAGGNANAFGGLPGIATGINPTEGSDGAATANAGNGGDGGDGCPPGAGGLAGTPTADGLPATTNTPTDGAAGIEWPVGCLWIWCIPLSELVPDPAAPGPIPDGYGSGPSDPVATILDAVTLEPIGTVPFNWSVPFDGDAQWLPDPPQIQLRGGLTDSTTIEIELVELQLNSTDPIFVNGFELRVSQAFNMGFGTNIGEIVVIRPDDTLIASMDIPEIFFAGEPTSVKLDFTVESGDIDLLLRCTALEDLGFCEIVEAIYIWDP